MIKRMLCGVAVVMTTCLFGAGDYNQTPTVSPVEPPASLPFTVAIELTDLAIPNGWHSGAMATWGSKCLLVAGRTNGLHGFTTDPNVNSFPPQFQNKVLYVIDFEKRSVVQRSLSDPTSGVSQEVIDTLSVTSPQSYQRGRTLYIVGGYGINTATGKMETKSTLTAIDIPGIIGWVEKAGSKGGAAKHIRQTAHPLLQVTGGFMDQPSPHMWMRLPKEAIPNMIQKLAFGARQNPGDRRS